MTETSRERHVALVHTPLDGEISAMALGQAGFDGVVCPDLQALCEELLGDVGVAILTEEAVAGEGLAQLSVVLAEQPAWSDLPIVLLCSSEPGSPFASAARAALGNVALLQRPVYLGTLVAALRSALRGRARQFLVCEQLRAQREMVGALRASQERLELVMRAADVGTWYCDLPPTEMVGSPAFRRHLGLDPAADTSIAANQFFAVLHPEDRPSVEAAFAATQTDGAVLDLDYRTRGPDGVERWVRTSGRALITRDGVPTGVHGTTMDLTARRAAVSALARAEARSVAIGAALPFGAWECDPGGRVVHLARAFLALVGRNLATCREEGWSDLVHPDDRERFLNEWPRHFASASMFDHEYRLRDESGQYRTVLMRGMPVLDDTGVVTGWTGINLDITEKRIVEQELERVDRLESVRLVAGGIAHDFNDRLTGLLGNVVLARLGSQRDPEVVRRLQDAELAGKQAQQLASQLLTFARGADPVRTPVWVPGLVRDSAEFALFGLGIRCDYSLAENLPGVEADPAQFGQVVQTLVVHGAKAMGGKGVLVIRAAMIRIGAAGGLPLEPGPYVMVSVTDRGRPIPPGELALIFDLLHSTRSGSGIGLPIAWSIIRRHGGVLIATSQPEGTTFTIYLPAGEAIEPPAPRVSLPPVQKPLRARTRLLVMDDDPQVRSVAYLSLVRLGYQVSLAVHGAQAVETYRTAMAEGVPFHVVFLDLTIPGGMGGCDALLQIREQDPDVKAVAVTGSSNDPLLANFAERGFVGAITKPFTLDDLSRVLQTLPRTPSA